MNKHKTGIMVAFLIGIMLFSLAGVMAEDPALISGNEASSLWKNFLHSINNGPFSVVGDSRGCSLNADMTWDLANGESLYQSSSQTQGICGGDSGLYDTYLSGWTPYIEYKDSVNVACSSFNGCHVELYCCSNPEPSSSSDCDSDQTLKTKTCQSCTTSNWPYYSCPTGATGYVCGSERGILYAKSSYKYCEDASAKTCYYKTSNTGTCYTRSYTTLSDCSTQTYMGYQLYNTLSACQGASVETCATKNYNCGTFNGQNCGTCSGNTPTCSNSAGGTCQAANPVVDDPDIKATINSILMTDTSGNALTSNPIPGQEVLVTTNMKVKVGDLKTTYKLVPSGIADPNKFCFGFITTGYLCTSDERRYLIESGVIPYNTAKLWGFSDIPTLSLFAVQQYGTECCPGQSNVGAVYADISKGNPVINGIKQAWSWYADHPISDADYIEFETSLKLKIPDSATNDICPVAGRSPSVYWGGNDTKYTAYTVIKNDCYAREGTITGYTKTIFKTNTFDINLAGATNTTGLRSEGEECSVNAQCKSGKCESTGLWGLGGKKCAAGIENSTDLSLVDLKKFSLTKDEIHSATTPMLFASSCYKPGECLPRENYTVTCKSIDSLRADETIATDGAISSFLDYGKGIVIGGTAGAAVGAVTGLWLCNAAVTAKKVTVTAAGTAGTAGIATPALVAEEVVTAAPEYAFCATVGTAVGAGVGALFGSLMIAWDRNADPLVKAFNAKDSSSIGICTAEESASYCKYTSWAAFYTFPGMDKCTSGLIIILIGATLLIIVIKK